MKKLIVEYATMNLDFEPRQIFNKRTGNLSQTTTLNNEVIADFMRVSDLRLDVVIEDSDKMPERNAVSVGSDILAWRSIAPLSDLTKVVFRPKKFHQTEIADGRYRILIHDRIIDDDIQKRGFQGQEDYADKYLARLNGEVKKGLAETIRREKLGLRNQFANYFVYFLALGYLPLNVNLGPQAVAGSLASLFFIVHPLLAHNSNITAQRLQQLREFRSLFPDLHISLPPSVNPRSWKEAFLPVVPVDKWIKGRRFLAKHGTELIIPKE